MKVFATVWVAVGMCALSNWVVACPEQAHGDIADPGRRLRQFDNIQGAGRRHAWESKGAAELRVQAVDCFYYPKLRRQDQIPCIAPLAAAYEAAPKRTRVIATSRAGKEVRVAVHLAGSGNHDCVLVCLPGVMSDHTQWRFVAGALTNAYDFWLIDPPGCGQSEAPDPAILGPDGYGPSAMADRELQAVAACLAEAPSSVRLVFVGHSLGGLVCLRAFADPDLRARHAAVISRVQGLVLFAPPDVVMNKADPHFVEMSELKGIKVDVARGLGVMRELVAKYMIESSSNARCLPREQVDNAVEIISDPARRHAFQAMLRQALPFHEPGDRPNWVEMHRLESWYKNVTLPVSILWGDCDETIPVAMGYKMAAQLPKATLKLLPDCTHTPNVECPAACAWAIREAEQSFERRSVDAVAAAP